MEAGTLLEAKGLYAGSHSKSGFLGSVSLVRGPGIGSAVKDYGQAIGLSAEYFTFDSNKAKAFAAHGDYQFGSDTRDWVGVLNVDYLVPEHGEKTWNPSVAFAAALGNTIVTFTPGVEFRTKHLQSLTGDVNVQYNLSSQLAVYGFYTAPTTLDQYSNGVGIDWAISTGAHSVSLIAESESNKTFLAGLKFRF